MLEGFRPVPVDIFGSRCTLIDRSDLPQGLSPDCLNVEFFPGGCGTRAAFVERSYQTVSRFSSVAGFSSDSVPPRRVLLTESGALYWEGGQYPTSALNLIATGLGANMKMKATAYGNRLFIAFSDGLLPQARARQWDGSVLTPLSRAEMGFHPSLATGAAAPGNMGGWMYCVGVAETSKGYLTPPSRAYGKFYLDPNKKWTVTDLAVYPGDNTDIVRRRLYVTLGVTDPAAMVPYEFYTNPVLWQADPAGGPETFTVNTITAAMLTGYAANDPTGYLIAEGIRPLPQCVGLATYSGRLIAWGVAHATPKISAVYDAQGLGPSAMTSLAFDSGSDPQLYWAVPSKDRPCEWAPGGGTDVFTFLDSSDDGGVCGRAIKLTVPTGTVAPYATQPLKEYVAQEPSPSGEYRLRIRAKRSGNLTDTSLNVCVTNMGGTSPSTPITIPHTQLSADFQWFDGILFTSSRNPDDTYLKIYLTEGAGKTNGSYVVVDELQIYPMEYPYEFSTLMVSEFNDPESFLYGTGEISVNENDGQKITNCYELRGILRVAKQHSLYSVLDTGDTPDNWAVERASDTIGALGPWAVGQGEGWAIIADDSGIYVDEGGAPKKISQEIQPDWDQLNLNAAHLTTVAVDTRAKRIYVLYPKGSAAYADSMLMCDYVEGFEDPISSGGHGRKWASWSTTSIRINDMGYILEGDGQGQMMFAGGIADTKGAIFQLDATGTILADKYTATGAPTYDAINSYYETATVGQDQGRSLFGYITMRIRGEGTLVTYLVKPNGEYIAQPARVLSLNPTHDIEIPLHQTGIQYGLRIGTNGLNDNFTVRRLSLFAKPAPFSLLRGHNK